jgi:predicted DNA-binding WGR domain protein
LRRFEFIAGNQARFWQIARRGAVLTTIAGKIGTDGKERVKEFADYMAAEQEFDRLVRDHLRRGYVEVEEASEPVMPVTDRHLILSRLDGKKSLELKPAATRYLSWRMIEVGVMDRAIPTPDLARWAERAARRLRLAEVPGADAPEWNAFFDAFLELSAGDRAAESGAFGVVGSFKVLEGSHWILTGKECGILAEGSKNRTPRRHKQGALHDQWLGEWTTFLEGAAKHGGALVTVAD